MMDVNSDGGKTRCSFDRREEFQSALRNSVVNDDWYKSLYGIYTSVIRRFPDVERSCAFHRVEGIMKNWQDGLFLQTPMTLKEYTRILLSESWENVLTEWNNVKMSVHTVQTLDEKTWATVFADHAYLQLFTEFTDFHVNFFHLKDLNVPKVKIIMTISVLVGNEWWPIAWALIEELLPEAFSAVFEVLNSVHKIMINPARIVVPHFKIPLIESMEMYFPSTKIICTMSVAEKLDDLKGEKYTEKMLKKNPRTARYFKRLTELFHLPAKEIKSEFEKILESAGTVDNLFLKELFDYYRDWWIEKIKPERYSLFEQNDIENSKIAPHLQSMELPETWESIYKPFRIWKFTERMLETFILLRESLDSQSSTESMTY